MICLIYMVNQSGRLAAARVAIPGDTGDEACATGIPRWARVVGMPVAVRGSWSGLILGRGRGRCDASRHGGCVGAGSVRAIQLLWGTPGPAGTGARPGQMRHVSQINSPSRLGKILQHSTRETRPKLVRIHIGTRLVHQEQTDPRCFWRHLIDMLCFRLIALRVPLA